MYTTYNGHLVMDKMIASERVSMKALEGQADNIKQASMNGLLSIFALLLKLIHMYKFYF